MITASTRTTKYVTEITAILHELGHATNSQLLRRLQEHYPEVSATTVHRVTQRLYERGEIASAPNNADGSCRYDMNTVPHDHFLCTHCGGIRDIDVAEELVPTISKALGGCQVTGRLVINGSCESCLRKGEKN